MVSIEVDELDLNREIGQEVIKESPAKSLLSQDNSVCPCLHSLRKDIRGYKLWGKQTSLTQHSQVTKKIHKVTTTIPRKRLRVHIFCNILSTMSTSEQHIMGHAKELKSIFHTQEKSRQQKLPLRGIRYQLSTTQQTKI